jgi:hypothetical protein
MDLFQDRKKYSPAEMRSLNYCRLSMDVSVVSDICDASGRNLLAAAMVGDKDALPSRSRDLPAHQEHPRLSKIWSLWRGALLSQLTEPDGTTLKTSLGKWLHHHSALKRQWTHLWSRTEHQVYNHVSGKMYEILDQGPGSLFHYKQPPQYLSDLPSNCVPVDIEPKDGYYTKHRTYDLYRGPQELIQNVPQFATKLEDWQWDLLRRLSPVGTHAHVATQLEIPSQATEPETDQDTWPVLVCDGSVMNEQGTFGWVISLPIGETLCTGKGPAYGHDISSYRAEAYGMLSGLLYLYQLFH